MSHCIIYVFHLLDYKCGVCLFVFVVGYGGIGPKTSSGKIATMIYAVFGIPIMLWYLSNVGSLLAKIARFVCGRVCCCCCCREGHHHNSSNSSSASSSNTRKISDPYYNMKPGGGGVDGDLHHRGGGGPSKDLDLEDERGGGGGGDEHRVSILFILILCVSVLLGYVCLGSYIVAKWEKWRFLDSFYFCFLTLTTISFGDSRAHKTGKLERFNQRTEWFCSFYILFGMALTSMFFNILHEEISNRFKRWKRSNANSAGDHSGDHQKDGHHGGGGNKGQKRRPVENSYSVHFMNFSSNNPSASRNFTEETLLSNEIHTSRGVMQEQQDKNGYDEEDIPQDYMSHPLPPPREVYSNHPVFPR